MLTDYLLSRGYGLFFGGWTQFGAAFATAFLIMILFGRPFIRAMHNWQKKGQPISENVPESHRQKAGTPTMGGILVLIAIFVGAILFMPMDSMAGWTALLSLAMFGSIGFLDDYKKVTSQSKKAANGLTPAFRLVVEGIFVVIIRKHFSFIIYTLHSLSLPLPHLFLLHTYIVCVFLFFFFFFFFYLIL